MCRSYDSSYSTIQCQIVCAIQHRDNQVNLVDSKHRLGLIRMLRKTCLVIPDALLIPEAKIGCQASLSTLVVIRSLSI